jgi:hypothetical protein
MQIDRTHHAAQVHQELHIGMRLILRIEEVDAGVGGNRPVVMLARAVDSGKGLLVQQRSQAMVGARIPARA